MNKPNLKSKMDAIKRAKKTKREYERSGLTLTEFAKLQGCSRQALSARLAKANGEKS